MVCLYVMNVSELASMEDMMCNSTGWDPGKWYMRCFLYTFMMSLPCCELPSTEADTIARSCRVQAGSYVQTNNVGSSMKQGADFEKEHAARW